MPSKSTPSLGIKPPRGLLEASRKLGVLPLVAPSVRARRVRQAAESMGFAVAWAESAAADVGGPDAPWLAEAISEMKRAEHLLLMLTADAERQARGWEGRAPEIQAIFERVQAIYAAGTAPAAQPRPVRLNGAPQGMPAPSAATIPDDALLTFQVAVDRLGLRDGLAYLVGLTDYRFAGLWRFEAGDQTSLMHYDRYDPTAIFASRSPGNSSGCVYMRTRSGFMTLDDVLGDPRGSGVARRSRTYHSVPVIRADGSLLATLCLHDVVARNPRPGEADLMGRVASFLASRTQLFLR